MRRFTVAILFVLSACSVEDPAKVEAQDAVKRTLSDPSSAEFQNLTVVKPLPMPPSGQEMPSDVPLGEGVCGEVNAKNKMGGYVGFKPFAYDRASGELFIDDGEGLRSGTTGKVMEEGRYSDYCAAGR